MSDTTDYSVNVSVEPRCIETESSSEANRYVFAYTVRITNTGNIGIKLISRHSIIEPFSLALPRILN